MLYREIAPSEPLRRFIECFWTLQGHSDQSAQPDRILPDGCVEIILNFADRFCEVDQRGKRTRQPRAFVVGQMERPIWIAPAGRVDILGIRFQPWGAQPLLHAPMSEMSGCIVELGALSRGLLREMMTAGDFRGDVAARLAHIERALLSRLAKWTQRDQTVERTSQAMLHAGGMVSISTLAWQSGISLRQLERRFARTIGIGPKRLAGVLRFQQVFRAMEQGEGTGWANVALDCGYYDQAHLIRDFRRYAGAAPSRLAGLNHLTELFLRKNRVSHFSKSPAQPAR